MADRSYVAPNRVERQRLQALAARLGDEQLSRPLAAGWTIAGVLGHLAYWDQRILVLIERWQQEGAAALPKPLDHADVDWINDAAKPMLLALSPRRAAELAVTIAEAVDRTVEALPDDLVVRNAAAGSPVNLLRAEHRREHLDEIERALRA
ncbi:MAG: maleylpyruvate isomerase N-terminal domain-containing protein [Candidatus Rokubacteria bacterium]|nr:maleylpyruvate isomerase N-terminal domain-containing protein [Candidatus Rokubacteria bacterium]